MDQNIHITLDMYQEAERYWLERLSEDPADCRLSSTQTPASGYEAAQWESELPTDVISRLVAISKKNHLSLYTVLTALVKTALLKWTGCQDIIVFGPKYNPAEHDDGFILFRDTLSYSMSFRDVVLAVKATVASGYKNQHFPMRHVFDRSGIPQSPSLFRHGLALDNIHSPIGELALPANVNVDWILRFNHTGGQLKARFEYDGKRFLQRTIQRFFEGFVFISRQVLENTGVLLADIQMVGPDERELILNTFNRENTGVAEQRTVNQWFKEVANHHSERVMLKYEEDYSRLLEEGTLDDCCFQKAPMAVLPNSVELLKLLGMADEEAADYLVVRTMKLELLALNNKLLNVLDCFDGAVNVRSIAAAIGDARSPVRLYYIEQSHDTASLTLKGENLDIDGSLEKFVEIARTLHGKSLLQPVTVDHGQKKIEISLKAANPLMVETKALYDTSPVKETGISDSLPAEAKSPVLLLGDTVGTGTTGILYLASYLRRHGIEAVCRWNDLSTNHSALKSELNRLLETVKPRLVGVSMKWFPHMARVLEMCRAVKEFDPGIVVIVGGNTASYYAEQWIEFDCVDYVVKGDGERPLLDLCLGHESVSNIVCKNGTPAVDVPVSYVQDGKNSGEIYLSHLPEVFANPLDPYLAESFFIYTGKGCRMNCFYCAGCREQQKNIFNRSLPFMRQPEEVAADMKAALPFTTMFMFDFDLPPSDPLSYYCQAWHGIDLSSHFCRFFMWQLPGPEFIDLLAQTFECSFITIDMCSLSEPHRLKLSSMGAVKPQARDNDIIEFLTYCDKYDNIKVAISHILGLPEFGEEDMRRSADFLDRVLSDIRCFNGLEWGQLYAEPGAPLVDRAETFNMISSASSFDDFMKYSRKNLDDPTYPGSGDIHYPYIYPTDETLASRLVSHYLDMNRAAGEILREKRKQWLAPREYTYRDIDRMSDGIAYELQQRGVGADSLVGMMSGGSLYLVAGMLAVLKAGGAYIPLAPDLPPERIRFILRDSGVSTVLKEPGIVLEEMNSIEVLDMDRLAEQGGDGQPSPVNEAEHLAYLIYTSGTTGQPKGTLIQHEGLVNYTRWRLSNYNIAADDVTLQPLSYSFDGFCSNFYSAILSGGTLVLAPDHKRKDFDYLRQLIRRFKATNVSLVPGMYRVLLEGGRPGDLDSLRFVVLAGERSPSSLVKFSKDSFPHISLFNEYGPTEATVTAACNLDMSEDTSLVGRPLENTRVYILDSSLQLMPADVPGELCIAGTGVARGYLNRPELTAEKFVSDPFDNCNRLYRTGDLAYFTSEGNISFLGRKELQRQVKIRGFRVELGEIEVSLSQHPDVGDAVVEAWEQESGESFLCGYVVLGERDDAVVTEEIQEFLRRRLPGYMVPAYLLSLESMPLDRHGKIDRRQLPDPRLLQNQEITLPRTMVESRIQAIWAQILGQAADSIGIDDNFFQLGGHSLKATLLVSRIHKDLQVKLALTDVFSQPTIRGLVALMASKTSQIFSAIEPAPKQDFYPLSPAQKRLFVLHQLSPQSTGYNIPQALIINGSVDRKAFQETFRLLVNRHESLRTSFQTANGQPVQKIDDKLDFQLEYWEAAGDHDKKKKVQAFVRSFDLTRAPLMRAGIIKVSNDEYLLLTDLHHIVADGVSHAVLLQEFLALHNGESLPPVALHYKDFSHWQLGNKEAVQEQERFWMNELSGELPVLRLPTDFRRPPVLQFDGREERFFFDADVTSRLKQLAQTTGSTMFMALLALWNVLLNRLSGQDDIIVGTPVAGRKHADLARVVGNFVNTLAIRAAVEEETPFQRSLFKQKEIVLQAFQHQDVQLEDIIDGLGVDRDTSRNPLFDVVFSYQDVEMETGSTQANPISGLTSRPYAYENTTAKFDLTLLGSMAQDRLAFTLQFSTRLFKRTTIQRFIACFQRIADQLSIEPDIAPGDLDIISLMEREKILSEWNDSAAAYPHEATVYQLFSRQVKVNPHGMALVTYPEKHHFSYDALESAALGVAALCRHNGIGRGMIVPVLAEKGIHMIAALLGIINTGATYLPIDPSLPTGRVCYMLDDCGANLVLTTNDSFIKRHQLNDYNFINVSDVSTETSIGPSEQLCVQPTDALYVIYTSGTTGKPKGVVVEHRNLVRLLFNHRFPFDFSHHDTWTMFHAFNFDFSVWEMYGALLYGGRLVVVDKDSARNTAIFLNILQRESVTVLNQTPTAFYTLSQVETNRKEERNLCLKTVVFGGEALNPSKLRQFHDRYPQTKLVNMFGITETTVHVTYKEITSTEIDSGRSYIGGPIPTLTVYVANSTLKLQPLGVPGELCVGGLGVARGYLNRPELTNEKFVANPYDNGDRLYRSGDLARLWEDGELEYLGRIDHQVQIRGFRVELGEIESKLFTHPAISDAVVRAIGSAAGDPVLHAFVIANNKGGSVEELSGHLRLTLPDYMIPTHVHSLDSIPRTPNGKVDQKALEAIAAGARQVVERLLPQSGMEKKIAAVWCEVLELDEVGVNENFFELGGNSLNIVLVNTRLKEELERDIPLIVLFQFPTISALYGYLTKTPQSTTNEPEDNVEETMSETVALFDNL